MMVGLPSTSRVYAVGDAWEPVPAGLSQLDLQQAMVTSVRTLILFFLSLKEREPLP